MVTDANVEISDAMLRRLKKLRNLADASKNNSPEQVAAAAAKLSELMLKWNLSISDVEGVRLDSTSAEVEYVANYFTPGKNGHYVWWRDLLNGIVENNYCRELIYSRGSTYKASQIIGQARNVEFCKYLYAYVREEIYRLSQVAYQEYKNSMVAAGYGCPHSWSYHTSFCRAAVATVVQRLREQRLGMERTNQSTTAIVIVKGQELENAVQRFAPHLYDGKKHKNFNDHKERRGKSRAGTIHGREAGEKIDLNRPLEQPAATNGAKLLR